MLKVQKLSNNATLPKRSTGGAVGYDLCASQDCTIPAGGQGTSAYGAGNFISSRSLCPGLLPDQDLPSSDSLMLEQVLSMEITGEKLVWFLFNHGDQDLEVKMGDRIAQLILEKIDTPPVEEV